MLPPLHQSDDRKEGHSIYEISIGVAEGSGRRDQNPIMMFNIMVCSIHWGSQSKATGTPNTETTRANDKGGKTFRPGLIG